MLMTERTKTPSNPAHSMKPTRVRILRAFFLRGQRQEPGTIVELPCYVAADMITLKKAEPMDEA